MQEQFVFKRVVLLEKWLYPINEERLKKICILAGRELEENMLILFSECFKKSLVITQTIYDPITFMPQKITLITHGDKCLKVRINHLDFEWCKASERIKITKQTIKTIYEKLRSEIINI